jgi:hypothetical protein
MKRWSDVAVVFVAALLILCAALIHKSYAGLADPVPPEWYHWFQRLQRQCFMMGGKFSTPIDSKTNVRCWWTTGEYPRRIFDLHFPEEYKEPAEDSKF